MLTAVAVLAFCAALIAVVLSVIAGSLMGGR